jgi:diketogulonate reductase-like aldo/keto reductase
MQTITLNNGIEIPGPRPGGLPDAAGRDSAAVAAALATGYRHVDTAAATATSGRSARRVRNSDVGREAVFLETKIWISDYGYDETLHGFDKSAAKLGVDQIDLLILHQALPSAFDRTLEAYRALEQLLADGRVRAIGVSNFMVDHLTQLLDEATVVPAVNQIEVHPYFQQRAVQALGAEHGIVTQAWSPIGGITFYREGEHTSTLARPTIVGIAEAHSKSPPRSCCAGTCSRAARSSRSRPRRTGSRRTSTSSTSSSAPTSSPPSTASTPASAVAPSRSHHHGDLRYAHPEA